MKPFQILHNRLDGINLVEASAGTGKTYALAALYLRLVLERGLRPQQILVVTYTEAATKELRERIRSRLREAYQGFTEPEAETADTLVKSLIAATHDRVLAIRRLRTALSDFDQAAIFTIHGFCQRTLQEHTFESGYLFDTELVTEQDDLKLEIVEDFWRRHLYRAPAVLVHHVLDRGYSPVRFMKMVRTATVQPDIKVVPQVEAQPWAAIEARFATLLGDIQTLQRQWPAGRTRVAELLRDRVLNANIYGAFKPSGRADGSSARDVKIDTLLDDLARYLQVVNLGHPFPSTEHGTRNTEHARRETQDTRHKTQDASYRQVVNLTYPFPFPEKFELLTITKLRAATRVQQVTPEHPLFEVCESIWSGSQQLLAALDEHLLYLKTELFRTLQAELAARKRERNIQHFDDLLLKLRDALLQPAGADLAAAVRSRYEAALIDEFQDTDPIQYDIFRMLFAEAGRSLFLIGDPKQAIYSFRGADVFAYMAAAHDIPEQFTLGTNWRSEPELIKALNTLFEARPAAFVYPEIGFHPVAAPEEHKPQPLTLDGKPLAPFVIWFVRSDAAGDAAGGKGRKAPARIAKGAAKPLILNALAAQISRLLQLGAAGRTRVGDRPLRENDLAVLLRTNREAREIKETLAALGVPAVLFSTDNVFDSHEALELERLLRSIAAPHNERLLRAALTTDLLGVTADNLMAMAAAASPWESWLLAARSYHQLWAEHGFIRMCRQLMQDHGVRARLVAFPDGERRLTNTLHLTEILHQEAVHRQLGMVDLIRWLGEQRNPDTRTAAEQQLRLESDDNAVRLVTIHKSKGLQYPVVFCPFVWEAARGTRKDQALLFHDEADARRLTLDLGTVPPERPRHEALAARETLAETLRLLYVALTRAEKHCTLVWGRFNQADSAAPAYLFHHRGDSTSLTLVDETEASFKDLDDPAVLDRLRQIEQKAGGAITVQDLPVEAATVYRTSQTAAESLSARSFRGWIERDWRVSSFSALTSNKPREGEWPDRDESAVVGGTAADGDEDATAATPLDIFVFPQGAQPGTLLHDILEHLDFTTPDTQAMATLVAQKLQQYGFDTHWQETILTMLAKLLRTPLGDPENPFTLADISLKARLTELEFFIPLERLTPAILREAFASTAGSPVGSAADSPAPRSGRDAADGNDPSLAGLDHIWNMSNSWASWLERLARLDFTPVHGFIRGFMDLVFQHDGRFYLVDWKSNHLGHSIENYGPRELAEAMVNEYYLLQYHLYVVALDRYLAMRLPGYRYEDHFGEVYYVFLRGVHPEIGPRYGVFRDRPPKALVEALSSTLF